MRKVRTIEDFLQVLRKAVKKYPMKMMHHGVVVGKGKDVHFGNDPVYWPPTGAIFTPFHVVWFYLNGKGMKAERPAWGWPVAEAIGLSQVLFKKLDDARAERDGHDKELRKRLLKACGCKEVPREKWVKPRIESPASKLFSGKKTKPLSPKLQHLRNIRLRRKK